METSVDLLAGDSDCWGSRLAAMWFFDVQENQFLKALHKNRVCECHRAVYDVVVRECAPRKSCTLKLSLQGELLIPSGCLSNTRTHTHDKMHKYDLIFY